MSEYASCRILVGLFILMGLISCNDSELKPPRTEIEQGSESAEGLTLDELGAKIQKEQEGEIVMPESKLISKMEYFEKSKHLILYFQRNPEKAYLYKNVPAEVWGDFKSAGSKGKFFGEKIRDVESYQMIR